MNSLGEASGREEFPEGGSWSGTTMVVRTGPASTHPASAAAGVSNGCTVQHSGDCKGMRVLYNRKIMGFLKEQLDKVLAVKVPKDACADSVDRFNEQIAIAGRLLRRHANPLEFTDFYKSEHAHHGVRHICLALKRVLQEWNLEGRVGLQVTIPQSFVQADREHLKDILQYIFCGHIGIAKVPQAWCYLKTVIDMRLEKLTVIDEGQLQLEDVIGEGGYGAVFKAKWGQEKVAVKKPAVGVEIQDVASFRIEAVVQASMSHDHIVHLHAVTVTGWLVMELADKDLQVLCDCEPLSWNQTVDLLLQGALGIDHMHSQSPPLVHSDVKTSNFLVFVPDQMGAKRCVKVGDFGQTFRLTGNKSKTIRRRQGTPLWVAPESYHGRPLTRESDVFSLGVVMYQVVTGRMPYETQVGGDPEAHSMYMKTLGRAPCKVDDKDCPPEMLKLMKKCVDKEPVNRPTMADVVSHLRKLPVDWVYKEEASGRQELKPSLQEKVSNEKQELKPSMQELVSSDKLASTSLAQEEVHPFSQMVELRFPEPEFADAAGTPGYLERIQIAISALFMRLAEFFNRGTAVISVRSPRQGSIVFPIQVEFSSRLAAALFEEMMQQLQAGLNEDGQQLPSVLNQPEVTVFDGDYIANAQVSELEEQLQQSIKMIQEVTDVKYGVKMIVFLQRSIARLADHPISMPKNANEKEWKCAAAVLLYHLKVALQLVHWHSCLDVDKVYRSADTKAVIEQVLSAIKAFTSDWSGLGAGDCPDSVPAECLQSDRDHLSSYLGYVLEGQPCDFGEAGETVKWEWDILKDSLEEHKLVLADVPEDEVEWGEPITDSVFKVRWRGAQLAGKHIIPADGHDMELEDYQKFYAAVYGTVSDPRNVVKIHGATRSGAVLMDLASTDLRQWYLNLVTFDVEARVVLKLKVLAQAARSLHAVHTLGRVHGRVKSSNFLLFGDDPEQSVVKISDLTLSVERWHKKCLPPRLAGHWIAKEVYEGQVPRSKSDVFSFGCVMYELLMEELPYGDATSEGEIMMSKLEGKQPFDLSRESMRHWPNEVLQLMEKCCSPNPNERPSMRAVDKCLQNWYPGQLEKAAHASGESSEIIEVESFWNHLPWTKQPPQLSPSSPSGEQALVVPSVPLRIPTVRRPILPIEATLASLSDRGNNAGKKSGSEADHLGMCRSVHPGSPAASQPIATLSCLSNGSNESSDNSEYADSVEVAVELSYLSGRPIGQGAISYPTQTLIPKGKDLDVDECGRREEPGGGDSSWKRKEQCREGKGDDTTKKPKVDWTVRMHMQFVHAVNQLGIDKAIPKKILELMGVKGLTRENVAMHLQRYRLYLKRLGVIGAGRTCNIPIVQVPHAGSDSPENALASAPLVIPTPGAMSAQLPGAPGFFGSMPQWR
ncbi:unnamed protein product [Ostreobium quekettii]|uniref:Protein kinase domain-containing protein n=1 Tax=Ostreobium quekettii TaxID=121088 RepID=A0A8S1JC89_9CHLO|nr:unnamed protein product [Ostreobium quekettii]